ncbi:MAG TPA: DUF6776 family protein [Fluviicoccus sp.]|nr:DUF6776 family protein [Fluviicoccus sp.]
MWQRLPRPRLRTYLDAPVAAHRLAWGLSALLAIGVSAATAFYLGYDRALRSVGASAAEVAAMRADGKRLQQNVAEVQKSLALMQQERDMAQETARKMQQDAVGQMDELSALREQLVTYQRMLGAQGGNGGLAVENLHFSPRGPGVYGFRLLLTQVGQNAGNTGGTVTVRVLGAGSAQPVAVAKDFRFQYFQAVSGELTLPKGFVPQSVEVALQAASPKPVRVQKRFKWEVGS